MDWETLKVIIDDLVANARRNGSISTIIFFGGEPLLRKDLILKTARYVAEKNLYSLLRIFVITNGTLITEDWLRELASTGVLLSFTISFDGPEHIHNMNRIYRDGRGTFKDVYRGLQIVRKVSNSYRNLSYGARSTVTKETARYLPEILEFFWKENIPFGLEFDVYNYDDEFDSTLESVTEKVVEVAQRYKERILNWGNYRRFTQAYIKPHQPKPKFCAIGDEVAIDTDGNIWPCHRVYELVKVVPQFREFFGGNVKSELNVEAIKQFADFDYRSIPDCSKCEIRTFCRGGCLALHIAFTGKLFGGPDKFCRAEKRYAHILFEIMKITGVPFQVANETNVRRTTGKVVFAFKDKPQKIYITAPHRVVNPLPKCLGGSGEGFSDPPFIRYVKTEGCENCPLKDRCLGFPVWSRAR